MAKIRAKLKQLRDADVRFISLVDRAATRIPFRVLKRENKMGIDLTKVFKSDNTEKPYVSALVVFAQKNEAVATQIQDAIKAHGFSTDRVQKSDEGETLVYAQRDATGHETVVRLSDQVLVSVGGLQVPSGWMGKMVEENGFFPDLTMAAKALQEETALVAKSDAPQGDAEAMLTSYAEYLNQMIVLPTAAYRLNDVVTELVQKACACGGDSTDEETTEPVDNPAEDAAEEKMKKKVVAKESPEEEAARKERIKDHPPSEMAPVDEEDDQKPPPEEAMKSDILAALKGIEERTTAQFAALTTKVEAVATEQGEQKKVLDGVVQKADTLSNTLKATVIAVPSPDDHIVGDTRMRVQKDDDPRTGNFDTAFLRRRRS